MIIFRASVTGINTVLSKKLAWKINYLSTENLLDPVHNYTESTQHYTPRYDLKDPRTLHPKMQLKGPMYILHPKMQRPAY